MKYHFIFKIILLAIKHSEEIKDPREIMLNHSRFKYFKQNIMKQFSLNKWRKNGFPF